MRNDIDRVLISQQQIATRVKEMASEDPRRPPRRRRHRKGDKYIG